MCNTLVFNLHVYHTEIYIHALDAAGYSLIIHVYTYEQITLLLLFCKRLYLYDEMMIHITVELKKITSDRV